MVEVVAWDFDGVLNRNIDDGRFLWARDFERDTGRSLDGFVRATFSRDWREVMTGREDLRDRVGEWATEAGYAQGADALIDYMFTRDALPDPVTGAMLDALSAGGIRQVIATNNEPRRAAYIEDEMGFGPRVERVFASGRMGVAKPDPAYFSAITDALGVAPDDMLLIDDLAANVDAARAGGWQAIRFVQDGYARLKRDLARLGLPCDATTAENSRRRPSPCSDPSN